MTTITKETNPRDLFNLLDSHEFSVVEQIVQLINENLNNTRESWLLSGLVDYYFLCESSTARDLIVNVNEPNDKHLMEKLVEAMKNSETRLIACRLLLFVVCKQQSWIHKIVHSPLFTQLIKCLKNDTDIAVLMTCLLVLINYLPVQPAILGSQYLPDICDVFSRTVNICLNKHGHTTEVYLLHLHATVYTLFHHLYAMYPCNFLAYLRNHYIKKENIATYEEAIKPMLERVRLHPRLLTGTKESETMTSRWKKMEVQDIVIDCGRMSLDIREGSCESGQCPGVMSRWMPCMKDQCDVISATPIQHGKEVAMEAPYHAVDDPNCVLWSPSVICGLSTPPPNQLTPSQITTSQIDTLYQLHHSTHSTFASTPMYTPAENTPRATPIDDIFDKSALSRNQSRASMPRHPSGGSNSRLMVNTSVGFIDTASLPASPLKPCFTSDPPAGTRRAQPCRAAQELNFGVAAESSCDRGPTLKDKLQSVRAEAETMLELRCGQALCHEATDSLQAIDAIVGQLDNQDNVDSTDQEVSELTRDTIDMGLDAGADTSSDEEVRELTAASVKQFMKNVNRIRFNSLTSADVLTVPRPGLRKKFSSCPQLVALVAEVEEGEEHDVVRSTSMMVHSELSPPEPLTLPPSATHSASLTSATPHRVLVKSASRGTILAPISEPMQGSESSTEPSSSPTAFQSVAPVGEECKKCRGRYVAERAQLQDAAHGSRTESVGPQFTSLSPSELLDRHIQLGGDVHTKELSQIPMTSGQMVNWTHFGGVAPVDEVNLLRSQLTLLHNQLLYERRKRELHAQRNRRLLHKITHAKSIEEGSMAMADQLKHQENEIHNLQVSLKLLYEQNEELYRCKESREHDKQIRLQNQEIETLQYGQKELQAMIVNQKKENDLLQQKLQESQHELFNCRADIVTLKERVTITTELREQITCLNKELLLKGEIHQRYQEQMRHKLQHQARPENEYLVKSLRLDISHLKSQLEQALVMASCDHSKVTEMEELLKQKELALADVKKKLEQVISSKQDQIAAVETKYQSMMKINQQLESYILDVYSHLDHSAPSTAHSHHSLSTHKAAPARRPSPSSRASSSFLRSHSDSPPPVHHSHHSASLTECLVAPRTSTDNSGTSPKCFSRGETAQSYTVISVDDETLAETRAMPSRTTTSCTSSTLSDSGSVMY